MAVWKSQSIVIGFAPPVIRHARARGLVRRLVAVLAVLAVLAGCGDGDDAASDDATIDDSSTTTVSTMEDTADMTPARFELTSPAFADGATIPERYSCQGDDISPELSWTDPPAGTVSFALVMDDPDAVPVAGKVWDHWTLWGLPGDARSLPEAVPTDETLADGANQGVNSFGRIGYGGPCPPGGQTHEYVFVLYALDRDIEPGGGTKADVLAAMDGHVLAESTLKGTFGT